MMNDFEGSARLADTETVKRLFPDKFDGCRCHTAFPDQIHTFVGDCSSHNLFVALVPDGDVRFSHNSVNGDNIIAVVGHQVSADYLEFLEDMQISYVFAGRDGTNMNIALKALVRGFGIRNLEVEVADKTAL